MLNSDHFDDHLHRNHNSTLVELDELMICENFLVEFVEEVDQFALSRLSSVELRAFFELELLSEYPAPFLSCEW